MSKTTSARAVIKTAMANIAWPVYYQQADEKAALPYVVYSVDTINNADFVDRCELEFNVVGYGRDTSPVEDMTDTIYNIFDHQTFFTDEVSFTTYFERKNNVEEPDRKIIRRRMTFFFDLYERG